MTVLGIAGTPRKGGNSELLLNAALEPFAEAKWDIRRILLSKSRIEPCVGCETCVERNTCFIEDDMSKVYDAFAECDAIIISAPSYWRNVPAQLKALFDRTFAVRDNKPLHGKFGGAISVGRATAGGGQSIVINIIYNFLSFSRCVMCSRGTKRRNGIC